MNNKDDNLSFSQIKKDLDSLIKNESSFDEANCCTTTTIDVKNLFWPLNSNNYVENDEMKRKETPKYSQSISNDAKIAAKNNEASLKDLISNLNINSDQHEKKQFNNKKANNEYLKQFDSSNTFSSEYMNMYYTSVMLNFQNQQLLQNIRTFEMNKPTYVWSGDITAESHENPEYSRKVFIGGIPSNVGEDRLRRIFSRYPITKIEWPACETGYVQRKGFAYIIFENEDDVKNLIRECKKNTVSHRNNSEILTQRESESFYYYFTNFGNRALLEIIPWIINDSCFAKSKNIAEYSKSVFMGGLHGKLTAQTLSRIMDDLFGGVTFVGIDLDLYNYPIGAGRVTFNNQQSYMCAVLAKFVKIKSQNIEKKIQLDPFLEDNLCFLCGIQKGQYFCRELSCFHYFCLQCWNIFHASNIHLKNHTPLTKFSTIVQKALKRESNLSSSTPMENIYMPNNKSNYYTK